MSGTENIQGIRIFFKVSSVQCLLLQTEMLSSTRKRRAEQEIRYKEKHQIRNFCDMCRGNCSWTTMKSVRQASRWYPGGNEVAREAAIQTCQA
jgi:hypothetical protein